MSRTLFRKSVDELRTRRSSEAVALTSARVKDVRGCVQAAGCRCTDVRAPTTELLATAMRKPVDTEDSFETVWPGANGEVDG
jgi:hypothetical protein